MYQLCPCVYKDGHPYTSILTSGYQLHDSGWRRTQRALIRAGSWFSTITDATVLPGNVCKNKITKSNRSHFLNKITWLIHYNTCACCYNSFPNQVNYLFSISVIYNIYMYNIKFTAYAITQKSYEFTYLNAICFEGCVYFQLVLNDIHFY